MRRLKFGIVAMVVAIAAFAMSVPALGGSSATKVTTVNVVAGKPSEFKYKFSRMSAPKGVVVFKVKNLGMTVHDLKINKVKTRVLNSGKSQTIRVNFKKRGKYPFVCTVPGHAVAGMKGVFIVK
jgi:uncharacterized cupredoxin-like copper-binding protein